MNPVQQRLQRPRVHIIDDDEQLGQGLANLLRSADYEVALFASPEAFQSAWRPGDRGCLLLDIHFPGGSGLDFQGELYRAGIALPVILMTGHADVPSSVRGMKAGAIDFLLKPFEQDDLFAAVAVALDKDAAQHRHEVEMAEIAERFATLTSREKEVMALVASGLMNKQVAGKLDLSEITVKVHRGTMMRKMQVRTLPALVRVYEILHASERGYFSGQDQTDPQTPHASALSAEDLHSHRASGPAR